jgi:hypothetical protein
MDSILFMNLYIKLPASFPIVNINNFNKALKLIKNKKVDKLIVFNWKNGYKLLDEAIKVINKHHIFPNYEVTNIIKDRLKQLEYIKDDSLKRFCHIHNYLDYYCFFELYWVIKIGNYHQGKGKYLIKSFEDFKNLKLKIKENDLVLFEEFVPNARSIRIIKINYDIFIVEQLNDSWLKNVEIDGSFKEVVYSYEERYELKIDNIDVIINNSKKIANHLKIDFCGIDYVVGKDKTGLLEVNDMIGLPNDERIYNSAINYFMFFITCNLRLALPNF